MTMTTWTWILLSTSLAAIFLGLREKRAAVAGRRRSNRLLDQDDALQAFARKIDSLTDRTSMAHLLEHELLRLFPKAEIRISVPDDIAQEFVQLDRTDNPLSLALCRDAMQRHRGVSRPARADRGASWIGALYAKQRALGVLEITASNGDQLSPRSIQVFELFAHITAGALDRIQPDGSSPASGTMRGLLDRVQFEARAKSEISRADRHQSPCSLLLLGFDDIHRMNRRNGVIAVEKYLQQLLNRIQSTLRTSDLVAQLGGQEFAILLPETDRQRARQIADRLLDSIARCVVECDGIPLRATANVGLACFPRDGGANLSILLRRAEEARYRSGKKRAS
jgi:diguanylate cyclase (GGDEF)-like protein